MEALYLEPRNLPGPLLGIYLEPLLGTSEPRGTLRDDCPRVPQSLVMAETRSFQLLGKKEMSNFVRISLHLLAYCICISKPDLHVMNVMKWRCQSPCFVQNFPALVGWLLAFFLAACSLSWFWNCFSLAFLKPQKPPKPQKPKATKATKATKSQKRQKPKNKLHQHRPQIEIKTLNSGSALLPLSLAQPHFLSEI